MTTPKTGERRRGIVYGVDLIDHESGQVRPADYVGQTRQALRSRGNQHRDEQPWSDLIVGDFYVIEQAQWSDPELDAAEIGMIGRLLPRMNYLHNEGNPCRVPKWTQREQRWDRDDRAGRPRWVHPDERGPGVAGPVVAHSGGLRIRAGWAWAVGAWAALGVLVWLGLVLAGIGEAMPLPTQAWTAALLGGVGVAWPLHHRHRRRVRRGR